MSTPAIEGMSWEAKLRALEELWDAITREGERYESPAWHEQVLMQTQQRHQSGAEKAMDWPPTAAVSRIMSRPIEARPSIV